MTEELFVNGELTRSRKETHGTKRRVFTSNLDYRIIGTDIRNTVDIKAFLNEIRANWNTYVSQVSEWIRKNPVKKLIVTGIFTVMLGFFSYTANAAYIQEYTYQVKAGDHIENIAANHGITVQEILDANGVSSIDGKKILLPKVQDKVVNATILNIRSQPSTKSNIIGQYHKDEVVKVAFIENGWAGILIKGRVCFVSAEFLTQQNTVSQKTKNQIKTLSVTKTMYVTVPSLRVRKAASTGSEILGSLKVNDRVSVTSIANGWAKIYWNGQTAFVSDTYLTNTEPGQMKKTTNNTQTRTTLYVIKKGDTFTKIGKMYGIAVSNIQKLNPKVDSSKLKIGQTIKLPSANVSAAYHLKVTAQIGKVNLQGTFLFITSDGSTYDAKVPVSMLNDLVKLEGEKVTLTLEGKRGQQLNLISYQ